MHKVPKNVGKKGVWPSDGRQMVPSAFASHNNVVRVNHSPLFFNQIPGSAKLGVSLPVFSLRCQLFIT